MLSTDGVQLPMKDADVRYYPTFLDSDFATIAFEQLSKELAWQQDNIKMFGRTVRIPRLQGWYGDENTQYRYSGSVLTPRRWHPLLIEIKQRCEQLASVPFNSVLANYYRDGNDSMGLHSDNEPELGARAVIASVSFGAERDFDFRHLDDTVASPCRYRLAPQHGSLLLMSDNTQQYWKHSLPKRRTCKSARLNLTYRYIIPNYHNGT